MDKGGVRKGYVTHNVIYSVSCTFIGLSFLKKADPPQLADSKLKSKIPSMWAFNLSLHSGISVL